MKISRLKKDEVVNLVSDIIGKVETTGGNWLNTQTQTTNTKIYFSQSKPSIAGKGHWNYDYFHTLRLNTLEEINRESGIIILINYVDKTYAILDGGDILWVTCHNSRLKSNEGYVIDFVIDRCSSGEYRLRPFERSNQNFRPIEIKSWPQ